MTPDWSAKPVTVPYAKFDDPQTLNLYSYTENAPINRIDADGHFNDPFGVLSGGAGTGWSNIESPVRFTISVTHTYTTTTVTLPGGARFTRTNDQSETQVSLYRGPVSGQGEELFTVTITYADGTKEHRTGKGHPRRDNNPGDIEYGPFARAAGAIGADGRFAIFPSEEAGFTALDVLLFTPRYQRLTIDDAIAKFAPPSENNTEKYKADVSKGVGVSGSTRVSSLSSRQMGALERTIALVEGFFSSKISIVVELPQRENVIPRN